MTPTLWAQPQLLSPLTSPPPDSLPSISRVRAGYQPHLPGREIHLYDSLAPDSMRTLRLPADTNLMSLDDVHRWDEALNEDGFIQHTGIIGKPVRYFHLGLGGRHTHQHLWRHPLTQLPNPYFLQGDQMPYHDAWKPLVHIHFNQSSFNTQLLQVTLSQNLLPWWNSTFHYRRRTATGRYANQTTADYNIYWNQWLHTRNHRWHLFAGFSWQDLNDGMNGGFRIDDDTPPAELFEGIAAPMQLNAQLVQRWRNAWLKGYGNPHPKLGLHLAATAYDFWQVYRDPGIYAATDINSQLFRPYGRLRIPLTDTLSRMEEGWQLAGQQVKGGIQLRNILSGRAPLLRDTIDLNVQYQHDKLPDQLLPPSQTETTLALEHRLHILRNDSLNSAWMSGLLGYARTENDLLGQGTRMNASLTLSSAPRTYYLLDSTAIDTLNYRIPKGLRKPKIHTGSWVPWQLFLTNMLHNVPPALMDVYWQGLTLEGVPTLTNEVVVRATLGIRHRWGKPRMQRGLAFRQNYLELTGFLSGISSFIHYGPRMQVLQTPEGTGITSTGMQLKQQQRLGRFYLRSSVTYQQQGTFGDELAGSPMAYTQHQPELYGRSRFFIEAKLFGTPADFQIGVEATGMTAFRGLAMDPSLQQWYPQYAQNMSAYVQLDAWFALRIHQTFIFLKMLHANEGLPLPGYFSAPFHPMQPRAFTFGVSWQFRD